MSVILVIMIQNIVIP